MDICKRSLRLHSDTNKVEDRRVRYSNNAGRVSLMMVEETLQLSGEKGAEGRGRER